MPRSFHAMKIRKAKSKDKATLLDIWLRSVRASHKFLSEADIQEILPLVRDQSLSQLEVWVLVSDDDLIAGFMGLVQNKLEALYIAPKFFRTGGGRKLVQHARKLKGPLRVDVNEQNTQAHKFYHALGFVKVGRSPKDSAGRPFPLIHMVDKELT